MPSYPQQLFQQPDANTPIDGVLVFVYSRIIKYGYNLHAVTRRLKSKLTTVIIPYDDQQDQEVRDVITERGGDGGGGGGGNSTSTISGSGNCSTCSNTIDSSYRVRRHGHHHHHHHHHHRRRLGLRRQDCPDDDDDCDRSGNDYDDGRVNNRQTSSLPHMIKQTLTKRPYHYHYHHHNNFTLSHRRSGHATDKRRKRYRSIFSILSCCRPWSFFIFKRTIHRYDPDEYKAFLKGTSVHDYRQQAAEIYRVMPFDNLLPDPTKPVKRKKSLKRRLLRI
ncbi:hypothetical protein V1509DRAFT_628615 [Lipomyces kononenkoae]